MASRRMNGDCQKMSKGQSGFYLNSIAGTQRPLSIYPPYISPNSLSTQLPTSPTLLTWSCQTGLQGVAHIGTPFIWGGVNVRVCPSPGAHLFCLNPYHLSQTICPRLHYPADLAIHANIIQPIPLAYPHQVTLWVHIWQGKFIPIQLYSFNLCSGTPQLDLWG